MNKYTIYQVGEFWEIFNLIDKCTVFVSDDRTVAVGMLRRLR